MDFVSLPRGDAAGSQAVKCSCLRSSIHVTLMPLGTLNGTEILDAKSLRNEDANEGLKETKDSFSDRISIGRYGMTRYTFPRH